ncbi:helix-turn-helix domain-containing protein [Labrys wisconsinensis]|uniref:DNA-binding XRE family transcriptional regulator n=1 Tax=Labrys wisconsinensis TaxID=425677 RepID=A0ABU0JEV7_9HYPH|nr:hypothetical protein [Labrys wisconsinensis]MDQ0471662.1 DNA-binding XRE family transcriptional regulator [Labrys wisconsinensis]
MVTTESRLIYGSSNGDRWLLVPEDGSGRLLVRHEPSQSSGGLPTMTDVGAFLAQGAEAPQHQALRALLGASLFPNRHEGRMFAAEGSDKPQDGRITAAQIRAARGLLGWSRERLALEAQLEREEVVACENGRGTPVHEQLLRIRRALELAGVVLMSEGELTTGGPGVRMGALGTSTGQASDAPEWELNDNDQSEETARAGAAGAQS